VVVVVVGVGERRGISLMSVCERYDLHVLFERGEKKQKKKKIGRWPRFPSLASWTLFAKLPDKIDRIESCGRLKGKWKKTNKRAATIWRRNKTKQNEEEEEEEDETRGESALESERRAICDCGGGGYQS
jgi:hypothetical protein